MTPDSLIIALNELKGIIRQKRVIATVTVVPLILMPLLLIGTGFTFYLSEEKLREKSFNIAMNNSTKAPTLLPYIESSDRFVIRDSAEPFRDISDEVLDLYVVFSHNFTETIDENGTSELSLYYSSAIPSSVRAKDVFTERLWDFKWDTRERRLNASDLSLNILDVMNVTTFDTASRVEKSGSVMGAILPYFVVVYLMGAAMSVGLDAVTGEKERNTLGTLLVNKVSRTAIVIGKIISVMAVSFVSSLFTIGGLGILLKVGADLSGTDSPFAAFTPGVILRLICVLIPLSVVIVAIIILLGTFARNMKEASAYISPVYIIVLFLGIMTLGINFDVSNKIYYIPIASSVFAMKNILSEKLSSGMLIVNVLVTLTAAAVLIWLCVRMFKNEKIMFRV